MIGQWYLKGQSNDAIHNRYIKTKTTQERLLRRTLHIWSSSFYIHRRKLEKDRSWSKRERNFAQKTNAHLWRRCTAIYAPFFQIMRLWRRARGYPNPCTWIHRVKAPPSSYAHLQRSKAQEPFHTTNKSQNKNKECKAKIQKLSLLKRDSPLLNIWIGMLVNDSLN